MSSSLATLQASSTALGGHAGPDLTRYLVVCAGLFVLVAALGWGFRRVLGRALQTRAAQRSLSVIDLLPMGGKQKLAVVRCYDRTFLLGLGEREVSLVAELDPVIAPAREASPTSADRRSFADLLARVRRSLAPVAAADATGAGLLSGTVPGTRPRTDGSQAPKSRRSLAPIPSAESVPGSVPVQTPTELYG